LVTRNEVLQYDRRNDDDRSEMISKSNAPFKPMLKRIRN
jgi:hypothetical protein